MFVLRYGVEMTQNSFGISMILANPKLMIKIDPELRITKHQIHFIFDYLLLCAETKIEKTSPWRPRYSTFLDNLAWLVIPFTSPNEHNYGEFQHCEYSCKDCF